MVTYYSYEEYDDEEYRRRAAPPPSPDPAVSYDPYAAEGMQDYQSYSTVDYDRPDYDTGDVTYQTYDAPPSPDPYTPPPQAEIVTNPYASFDPGYTVGEQAGGGYAPPPSYDPNTQLPPDQNAIQALDFGPFSDPAPAYQPPATRTLAPQAPPPERNPRQPTYQPPPPQQPPGQATVSDFLAATDQNADRPELQATPLDSAADFVTRNENVRPGSEEFYAREQEERQRLLESQRLAGELEAISGRQALDYRDFAGENQAISSRLIPQMEQYDDDRGPARTRGRIALDPVARVTGSQASQPPPTDPSIPILSGLGDLAGTALSGLATDYREAYENLTPAQRDRLDRNRGVRAARALGEGAGAAAERISQEDELAVPIEDLGEAVSQVPGLGDVGRGIAGLPAYMGANWERAAELLSAPQYGNVELAVRMAYDLQEHGDPYFSVAQSPGTIAKQVPQALLPGMTGLPVVGGGFNSWLADNPLKVAQGIEVGYTTPDGYVWPPGERAVWEIFQSEHNAFQRGIYDVFTDPTILLAPAAGGLKAASGTARAAGTADSFLGRAVGKLETPLDVAATIIGAPDTATDEFLRGTVGGGWWRRGRLNPLQPTSEAQARLDAQRDQELAAGVIGLGRGQTDAIGGTPPGTVPPSPGTGPRPIDPNDGGWDSTRGTRYGDFRIIETPDGDAIITRAENSEIVAGPMSRQEAEAEIARLAGPADLRRSAPIGRPPSLSNVPEPTSRVEEMSADGNVRIVSDYTGQYWLENPDHAPGTPGGAIYGPLDAQTMDEQLGNAAQIVREARLAFVNRGVTATEITGRTTAEQPLPPEQVQRILGPDGEPISTVPVDARRASVGGPQADPNLVTRLVDPNGQPVTPSGVARQAPGEEAFARTSGGTMPEMPAGSRLVNDAPPNLDDLDFQDVNVSQEQLDQLRPSPLPPGARVSMGSMHGRTVATPLDDGTWLIEQQVANYNLPDAPMETTSSKIVPADQVDAELQRGAEAGSPYDAVIEGLEADWRAESEGRPIPPRAPDATLPRTSRSGIIYNQTARALASRLQTLPDDARRALATLIDTYDIDRGFGRRGPPDSDVVQDAFTNALYRLNQNWGEGPITPIGQILDEVVAHEFNLRHAISGPLDHAEQVLRTVTRAIYDETQDQFQREGRKTITAYRGIDAAEVVDERRALTSWSANRSVAARYANGGQVIQEEIPVERIFSTGKSGPGQLDDAELVVLTGDVPPSTAYPLREDAQEIARLRNAAVTNQPVEAPIEPSVRPDPRRTAPVGTPDPAPMRTSADYDAELIRQRGLSIDEYNAPSNRQRRHQLYRAGFISTDPNRADAFHRLQDLGVARSTPAQPSRVNEQGESLSPEGWTPSTTAPRAKDHTRGAQHVPRLRGDPTIPREDSWMIDTGTGLRPMTAEDAQRGFDLFSGPRMTTQKFDSPDAVQWRTAMFDHGLIDYVPSPRDAYRSFVEMIAPLVRKEGAHWDAIANRGDFPETTIDHARRLANGKETLDDIMADVANREDAASYLQRRAAASGRTLDPTAKDAAPPDAPMGEPSPGAGTRSPESLGFAIDPKRTATEFFERGRRPGYVQQATEHFGAQHIDALQRQPGRYSNATGLMLDEEQEALLQKTFTKGPAGIRHREVGSVLMEYQSDMSLMRRLNDRLSAGHTLAPRELNQLTALENKFGVKEAPVTDTDADDLVQSLISRDLDIEHAVRDEAGKIIDTRTKAGRTIDAFLSWMRKMTLYDTFGGPAYAMLNLVGNAITAGIARPSALPAYFLSIPSSVRKSFRGKSGGWTDDMFEATGLGKTDFLSAAGRDQVRHTKDLFPTRVGAVAGKVTGMQPWRDLSVGIDGAWREGAYRNVAQPALKGMRREIARHAEDSAVAWTNRGKDLGGLTATQIREAVSTLPRDGRFRGEDVQRAILDLLPEGSAIPADLMNFADRLGRDWKAALRAMDKGARKQTDRLAFPGTMTVLDQILSRGVLFHYWNSRATRLYITEGLKKPYLLGAYFDFMDWAQEEAERQNAPGYVKWLLGSYDSPAGVTLFLNPTAIFSTFGINQDTQMGDADGMRLTGLGRLQIEGWNPTGGRIGAVDTVANALLNLMPNYLLDAGAYVIGAKGTDGKLPYDPLQPWTKPIIDLANLAAQHGIIFPGVQTTADGNPVRVPQTSFTNWLLNQAAQRLSGERGWTQQIEARNFDATAEAEHRSYMATAARRLNEGATDTEIARLVDDALLNPDDPIYQDGLAAFHDAQWEAGLGIDWPEWVRGPANVAARLLGGRFFAPVGTERNELRGKPREELTEGQQAIRDVIYDSPEAIQQDATLDGYYAIGHQQPGQPLTAENIGRRYANAYSAIKGGRVTSPFTVDGVEYTPDLVNALSDDERFELAKAWMSEQEYAGADAWDLQAAYYEARDAYLAEHPEIAAAVGIDAIAAEYPGGVELWIRDTRAINPAYDAFLRELEQRFAPGTEDWLNIATSANAALAIQGQGDSIYEQYPETNGQVAGMPAGVQSIDAYAIHQQEQRAAEQAEREADAAEPSDFEQDAWNDLQKVNVVMTRLDELDAYYGIPVGTSRNIYLGNLLNTSDEYLPRAVYDTIKAEYDAQGGSYWPNQGGGAEQYLQWANQQPQGADVSFETWSEYSLEQYIARQDALDTKTAEMDPASLIGRSSPPRTEPDPNFVGALPRQRSVGSGVMTTATAPVAATTPAAPASQTVVPISTVGAVNARSGPGIEHPVQMTVQNGAPLQIVGRTTNALGEEWANVQTPDGLTFWIRADLLGRP